MRFAELLANRLKDLDMSQVQLAAHLTERGIPTTKQAVHLWCRGESRPETWKRITLYDVLAVPLGDRDAWTDALLERRGRPNPAHEAPSCLEPEPSLSDAPTEPDCTPVP